MSRYGKMDARERLVHHVQALERVEALKREASDDVREAFEVAKSAGFDPQTLRIVLKLRRMTPDQRRERRALEAIYMAALGMLEGEPLPDEARRRLDGAPEAPAKRADVPEPEPPVESGVPHEVPRAPEQPPLIVKDPQEARQEGEAAAEAGKRIYDNPYRAGDPCRAAWDEGWCAQKKSHGMETPAAYQRRSDKPPKKDDDHDKGDKDHGADDAERGAA